MAKPAIPVLSVFLMILFGCCVCWPVYSSAGDHVEGADGGSESVKTLMSRLGQASFSGSRDSLAQIWLDLSTYYGDNDTDSTIYCCEEGLVYADRNTPSPYIDLLVNLASAYFAKGDTEEALRRHMEAYHEAVRVGSDATVINDLLAAAGLDWKRKSEPDSALFYYTKALEVLDGLDGVSAARSHVLTNIAILYTTNSRLDEAEEIIGEAVRESLDGNDIEEVIYAASSAGAIMVKNGNPEEGARMLHKALGKARTQRQLKYELKTLTYMIAMFNYAGNIDSVEFYDVRAREIMGQLPSNLPEVLGYKETEAKVFASIGRYEESNRIFSELKDCSDSNQQSPLDVLYLSMARNYMAMGMYSAASEYYEKAWAAADSIHNDSVQDQLSNWSVKYETKEKELDIARLEEARLRDEASRVRWIMTAVFLMMAFLSVVIYYVFKRRSERKAEELLMAQRYIEGLEKERSRLAKDLHDGVCNDLLGIGMILKSSKMLPGDNDRCGTVLSMVEKLREDVRYISHELMPPEFRSTSLDEIMESYVRKFSSRSDISLQFIKHAAGIQWKSIPDNISYEVYRIFQELLSNVVRHSGATSVEIELSLLEKELRLEIRDDGRTLRRTDVRNEGIGLSVIHERVKAIGASLTAEEGVQWQHFALVIPF